MAKRLTALLLCICLLIPFGANLGLATLAADKSEYVLYDLNFTANSAYKSAASVGCDMIWYKMDVNPAVDLTKLGTDYANLALEMDLKLVGDNKLVDLLSGTDADRRSGVSGELELTSTGTWDKEEIHFLSNTIQWVKNDWTRVTLKLSDAVSGGGTFNPANWNFFRWHLQPQAADVVGLGCEISICNVRIVDITKADKATAAEKVVGNEPTDPEGYAIADLPYMVSVNTTAANGGELFATPMKLSDAIDLQQYIDAGASLGISFDVYASCDDDVGGYLSGTSLDGQIELTSSGSCDNSEICTPSRNLGFVNKTWRRTVLSLSQFNTATNGSTGPFDASKFNYLRIYVQCRSSELDGRAVRLVICNVQIVDMNKKAPSITDRPLGDGSFDAEAPEYFEVKTPEGYDNSETVVAGYNVREYAEKVLKKDPDKVENWSPIIQSLSSAMSVAGGGVVYIPAGHYKCTTSIALNSGVTLYGDWRDPNENPEISGTVLEVYYGEGLADGLAFIQMANSTKVQNLAFWYPEQDDVNDITPYAATISTHQYTRVENVTLVNSYNGILNTTSANCPAASRVYGTPLNNGIDIGNVIDICRLYDVRFAASYWENSGLAGAPTSAEAKTALEKHLRDRATGIIYRRVDWSYVNFCQIKGYNIGMAMLSSTYTRNGTQVTSYINGQLYGNLFEDCAIALYCEGTSDHGEAIVDTEIRGCDYGLYIINVHTEKNQHISLSNVKIDASVATVYQTSPIITLLEQCTLSGSAVQLMGGVLNATNCTFLMDGPHILAETGTTGMTLAGNKDKDGKPITVDNAAKVPMEKDDATVTLPETVTLSAAEAAEQVKKPAGNTVKIATELDNTGKTDVTAALQALLDSLKTSGGLLYLPAGHYRLDGTITIPTGVELKGALNSGRVPTNCGTVLEVYGGKDAAADATATVTLQAKSGISGIVFNWPEQYADGQFHSYPYAMRGTGSDIYIVHTSIRNAWLGVDMFTYRCDNHYINALGGTSFAGGIHVGGGSQNGVLRDCHFNYNATLQCAAWGWGTYPNGLSKDDWEDVMQEYMQNNNIVYRFGDVDNELVYSSFTYSGKYGLQFVEENGNAPDVRVFCQSVDYGTVSIDVQAAERLDIVSTQLTAFDQLPEGKLKSDTYAIHLGENFTGTVNVRSFVSFATATANGNAIYVENGTLNMFGATIYRTYKPIARVTDKGKLNLVSLMVRETSLTTLLAEGSNGKNVTVKVGTTIKTPTDTASLAKCEGLITRLNRWDVPDETKAFNTDSKVLFSEGFTDYTKLSDSDKIFKQKNNSTMTSGSVARSGRMILTVTAQETSALILTDTMEIPQGGTDSLYRLETRLNLSSMREGSVATLAAHSSENDMLNLAVFNADGTVVTQGKKSVGTFETNQWYRLAIELDLRDTANKTMQVYLYDDEYKLVGHSDVIALPSYFQGEYEMNRLQWSVENTNLSDNETLSDETILMLDYVLATYSAETTFGTLGDVDGDGKITSTDARLALQCYAGKISADKLNTAVGDVDGDGKITSTDARLILQRYVGKISKFPVE